MAEKKRLYRVRGGPSVVLVEASTPAQALRHVSRETFTVDLPSSLEVAKLVASGITPEVAGEE